ncbi:MAG: hypothetical protein ABFC88_12380 [Thermoguttaceae bacterium]
MDDANDMSLPIELPDPGEKVWVTNDGTQISVTEMEDDRLLNAINFINRRIQSLIASRLMLCEERGRRHKERTTARRENAKRKGK